VTRSAAELVAALLAATPEPPDDADPETVLERAAGILAATAPLIGALRTTLSGAKLPGELVDDAAVLQDRTQRWLALAEAARRETADSIRSIARARAYGAQRP
jgi:hypothetical protein